MRIKISALLTIGALSSAGCGGGGSSGGAVTAPTAPIVPAAQPPAVNVSAGIGTLDPLSPWLGQGSSDQIGTGNLTMSLVQTGAQVTGTLQVLNESGPIAGTVSANTLVFNWLPHASQVQGCGNAVSGTATVSSVNTMTGTGSNTANSMTATFSGRDCLGNPITNGTFTASYGNSQLSATRFPLAGTWTKFLPPTLGGGTWTWILAQDGDVNGGNLTGSVTFGNGNTLGLGAGTVTGTFTNTFSGPPQQVSAVTTISFTGACPATMTLNWAYRGQDGLQLDATSFSGSSCNGPFDQTLKPGLMRR